MTLFEDKTKLSIQSCGSKIAVCIEGPTRKTIERRFWSFWNHGATNGELQWHHETRAHFWTTDDKLLKSIHNAVLFKLLNKYEWFFGDNEEKLERAAASIARTEVGYIPRVSWVTNVRENLVPHDVSTASAEFGDDEDITKHMVSKNRGSLYKALSWAQ
jgi:hypothetical protein